jgi:glycerol uptake facilitator protein
MAHQDFGGETGMQTFLAEMIGSMFLVTLGFSSQAANLLNRSWGKDGGWLMMGLNWGIGLAVGLLAAITLGSQGHVNPMITLAFIAAGIFPASEAPLYFAAQITGGILSGVLIWLLYLPLWRVTDDKDAKLACFAMAPAIRMPPANFLAEALSFFIFVVGIFLIVKVVFPLGVVPGCLVTGIWLTAAICGTGGQTGAGYGIDLGPRIAHQLLPVAGKRDSDWSYAWVPVLGPAIGGIAAALASRALGLV